MTSLKYAHVERERRWLLATVHELPSGAPRRTIVDRYVRGTRLRLREVTEGVTVTRKLGQKVRLGDGAAEIAHTTLYLDDAEWELLKALPADVLTKERTLVSFDGWTVAVDTYADGTVLAEVDIGDGPLRELPPAYAVVREVSDDEAFTGAQLARREAG